MLVAFGSATDEGVEKFLYFKSVNRIRQPAVHRCSTYRWNFDTRIIKNAAACAQYLGNNIPVKKTEVLGKVLYVDPRSREVRGHGDRG